MLQNPKIFPGLSVCLSFGTHFTFGWFLHRYAAPVWVWLLVVLLVAGQISTLTILWQKTRLFVTQRLQSDIGYFIVVLTFASLAVVAVVWIQVSAYLLVMLSSNLLIRLDTLILKLNEFQAFCILLVTPLLGFVASQFLWMWWTA